MKKSPPPKRGDKGIVRLFLRGGARSFAVCFHKHAVDLDIARGKRQSFWRDLKGVEKKKKKGDTVGNRTRDLSIASPSLYDCAISGRVDGKVSNSYINVFGCLHSGDCRRDSSMPRAGGPRV